jgi:hypothetical protein
MNQEKASRSGGFYNGKTRWTVVMTVQPQGKMGMATTIAVTNPALLTPKRKPQRPAL